MTRFVSDSNMTDVAAWLTGLGYARFVDLFLQHEITADALPLLTEGDLREIGIPLGPRRMLLARIAELSHDDAPALPVQNIALRRQISVLFCDLANSTNMSFSLDPEDMSEILGLFRSCVTTEIDRHGGYVAKYMGDGILAYFGYPQAREDDAERAVRAGLSITRRMEEMKSHAVLQTRTGIATGLVVVGDLYGSGSSQDRDVVGTTPNLAARLQSIAEPSAVIISKATQSLTRGLFEYSDPRDVQLKGFKDVVKVFDVVGESGVKNRFEALRSRGTPLIGRNRELAVLDRCWEATRAGRGQVLSISGEAGIGKSRLLSEFLSGIPEEFHSLKFNCSPDHVTSPLRPVAVQLSSVAGISADDDADVLREKVAALVPDTPAAAGRVDVLADLLSSPTGKEEFPPSIRKQHTFTALLDQIKDLARSAPVVAAIEDAHWIDASSLELMELLVQSINAYPVLLIVTARPEFKPPWQAGVPASDQQDVVHLAHHLNLGRLDPQANYSLVRTCAEGSDVPVSVLEQIARRTDGIPLFIEEVTRAVVESSQSDRGIASQTIAAQAAIPVTLQDSLTARLDRLGPAVEIAQIGSVIGREFDLALLTAVEGGAVPPLLEKLEQLVQSQLIEAVQKEGQILYRFKHALVQDAAYSSLLRNRRVELHGKVAEVLEGNHAGVAVHVPEVRAHHWALAGQPERAIERYLEAVNAVLTRSAASEANMVLKEATSLLPKIKDQILQKRFEAEIHLLKAQVLALNQAVSSADVGVALERAQALAHESGDHRLLTAVLVQRWSNLLFMGEPRKAKENAEKLFDIVPNQTDDDHFETLLSAHLALALVDEDLGNLENARHHFELAQALSDDLGADQVPVLGLRPAILIRSFRSLVLFQLGYPDKALAFAQESLRMAEEQEHPLSICMALAMDSIRLFACRDADALYDCGARFQAIARRHSIPFYDSIAQMSLGAAMILKDGNREGLTLLEAALAAARDFGFVYQTGILSCTYLECLLMLGETETGLAFAEDRLEYTLRTGEEEFFSEQLRLKGELLMQAGKVEEAKDTLQEALRVAQNQKAKMWELRAALSLSRILCKEGDAARGRALVAPVFECFTEGFELQELQEARKVVATSEI